MPSLAAQLVTSVAQLDDSGANTADRYDWQAAMAAADGLRLYFDGMSDDGRLRPDCQDEVRCEWHEDWILMRADSVTLVSAKHRDPGTGAYTTVNQLADEGGLAHLLNRWTALQEQASCRLVTSGGLGKGPPQDLLAAARHFGSLQADGQPVILNGEFTQVVTDLRKAVEKNCKDTKKRWAEIALLAEEAVRQCDNEVARFLAALTIEEGKPQRDHVSFAAPSMYVGPILDRMAATGSQEAVWEAVLGLFRVRMRSRGPLPTGGLPSLDRANLGAHAVPPETERKLASRTVTVLDIDTAITKALTFPAGYQPLPLLPRLSRLEAKMSVEGCSENAIERALTLRTDYQTYWRDRQSADPIARADRQRLERSLHRISDHATGSPPTRGAVFWRNLQSGVESLQRDALPAGMDADLALGGICDLAGQCRVWFGPQFDFDAYIARVRAGRDQQR